jgi:O-antigen/teichoic acid export membrane protein
LKTESLIGRVFSGISAGILSQATNFIAQFFSIGLFIRFWGEAYYGEWLIIFSFSQYLTMGDIGISATLGNKIASLLEKNEVNEANKWFNNGLFFLSLFSSCLFILIFFIVFFFQKNQFHLISENELLPTFIIILLYVLLIIQTNLYSSIYSATLKYARARNIETIAKLLELIFIFFALYLEGKIIEISCFLLLNRVIIFIFVVSDVRKKTSWLKYEFNLIDKSLISQIVKPSLANMALNLGYLMYYHGIIILAGNYLGSIVASRLYVLLTILRIARQIPLLINLPLYPEYARFIGIGDFRKIKSIHKTSLQVTFLIALISIVFTYIFAEFVARYLSNHKDFVLLSPFFELASISLFIQCIWHCSSAILVAGNNHVKLAIYFIISCTIGYMIIIAGITKFGLISISLGLLFIDIFMFFVTFKFVLTNINEQAINLFKINYLDIINRLRIKFNGK